MSAQIAARGDVATLLDGMELLEADANASGYREIDKSIEIGGTPAGPDASAFWALLEEGASNAHGSYGFALRMLNRRLEKIEPTDRTRLNHTLLAGDVGSVAAYPSTTRRVRLGWLFRAVRLAASRRWSCEGVNRPCRLLRR